MKSAGPWNGSVRLCPTHGDLWRKNIVATGDGAPVLIDPAVSYTWPEVDLSMPWCSPRPAVADRFFAVHREIAGLQDAWGAAEAVREIVRPFRTRPAEPARPEH